MKKQSPPPGAYVHHFDENGHIPFLMNTKSVFSCVARKAEDAMRKFRNWQTEQKRLQDQQKQPS